MREGWPRELSRRPDSSNLASPFTLHPSPFTLHPSPFTLHPSPFTLHPSPFTLHPSPFTLHPSPFTLHHPTYLAYHPIQLRRIARNSEDVSVRADHHSTTSVLCHPIGKQRFGLDENLKIPISCANP